MASVCQGIVMILRHQATPVGGTATTTTTTAEAGAGERTIPGVLVPSGASRVTPRGGNVKGPNRTVATYNRERGSSTGERRRHVTLTQPPSEDHAPRTEGERVERGRSRERQQHRHMSAQAPTSQYQEDPPLRSGHVRRNMSAPDGRHRHNHRGDVAHEPGGDRAGRHRSWSPTRRARSTSGGKRAREEDVKDACQEDGSSINSLQQGTATPTTGIHGRSPPRAPEVAEVATATTPPDTLPAPPVILVSNAACQACVTPPPMPCHGDQLQGTAAPFTDTRGQIQADPVMATMVADTPPSATPLHRL